MKPLVLSDATAALDLLRFDRYLTPIIKILTNEGAETPFTVGIFGAWGSGKSTLLEMVERELKENSDTSFVRIRFNAWVHRREPNMLVPLLHTLHDTLNRDPKKRFDESARKIANVLLRLGAGLLLKSMTADAVSLEKLETLEAAYNKERGLVESEIRNLRKTLQEQMNAIYAGGARVVFFIDDVDRCDPKELIDLLEAIKLFLDLEHVFVLLAIDKEIVDRGIQCRYAEFPFGDEDRAAAIGAEYLEKLIQLPMTLSPMSEAQVQSYVDELLRRLGAPEKIVAQAKLLREILVANPRKIKRVLNILNVTFDVLERSASQDLKEALMVRLVAMQVQHGDLYAQVVKLPELLLALEDTFSGKALVDQEGTYARFGSRQKQMQELCTRFYRPDSAKLAALFKRESFSAHANALALHLSLLA